MMMMDDDDDDDEKTKCNAKCFIYSERPRRAPQITAFKRVFVTMAKQTARANKSAHGARKA